MNLLSLVQRLRTLHFDDHPGLDHKLRWMLLDTWACVVAGSPAPPVAALAQRVAGAQPGRVWAGAASPQPLALWWAMASCWDEACEGHAGAHGRPGVAALAALVPLARDLTWDECRRALLVGYEVGARMGAVLRIRPGMHVDGNWPALGAAAAAAVAMGLNDAQVVAGVAVAACQLPLSLYRPVQTGDTARNTYLGHAAVLGQLAALSVASGITAPADSVQSYARVGLGLDAVPWDDSEALHVLGAYFKPYAAVRHVHYGAWAASLIRDPWQKDFQARLPAKIELHIYEEATIYCGNRQPHTPLQAQFSLSFGLAAMLRWGHLDPWVYREPQFYDARLRELEAKVEVRVHAAWTAARQRGARLVLQWPGGSEISREVTAVAGDPAMPLSNAEFQRKFLAYCASGGQAEQAPQWWARVLALAPDSPMSSTGF